MCLINVCIKIEKPGSFTFNYAASFFFSLLILLHIQCLSICIPIEITSNFFMQVCIIEYLLGTSQVNVYRASKKNLCIVRT